MKNGTLVLKKLRQSSLVGFFGTWIINAYQSQFTVLRKKGDQHNLLENEYT
jgi:hypothetical protein